MAERTDVLPRRWSLDIDNNACKRAIRPFVIGRKNWLFMGNVKGAQAAATIYSVIETAKANGLNPSNYFRYILLTKLPITPAEELSILLPWACKEAVNLFGRSCHIKEGWPASDNKINIFSKFKIFFPFIICL